MSLGDVKKGNIIKIDKINDIDVKNYLIRFGIDIGSSVECLQRVFNGPVVIKYNRQEIALGKQIAQNILVTA